MSRGALCDGIVFDAVRVWLIEIGEAIKALPAELLQTEPETAWTNIARMRDRLAHRYFNTGHSYVSYAVSHDLEPLEAAIVRLRLRLRPGE